VSFSLRDTRLADNHHHGTFHTHPKYTEQGSRGHIRLFITLSLSGMYRILLFSEAFSGGIFFANWGVRELMVLIHSFVFSRYRVRCPLGMVGVRYVT
jgi:hypothetical protein